MRFSRPRIVKCSGPTHHVCVHQNSAAMLHACCFRLLVSCTSKPSTSLSRGMHEVDEGNTADRERSRVLCCTYHMIHNTNSETNPVYLFACLIIFCRCLLYIHTHNSSSCFEFEHNLASGGVGSPAGWRPPHHKHGISLLLYCCSSHLPCRSSTTSRMGLR